MCSNRFLRRAQLQAVGQNPIRSPIPLKNFIVTSALPDMGPINPRFSPLYEVLSFQRLIKGNSPLMISILFTEVFPF